MSFVCMFFKQYTINIKNGIHLKNDNKKSIGTIFLRIIKKYKFKNYLSIVYHPNTTHRSTPSVEVGESGCRNISSFPFTEGSNLLTAPPLRLSSSH